MTNNTPFLRYENISKSFENQMILNDITLEIKKGEIIAIVGPSGTGKTTFLNIAGTIDLPDKGNIYFYNKDITLLSEKERSTFRNKNIGFVFQSHLLLPQCTVLENILIPTILNVNKSEKATALIRAKELLNRLGMTESINKFPGQLSGGECQRTAFIRSLINQPEIILADEPTGSLDEENASILFNELININKELNTTMIIVTHSTFLANQTDRIVYLKNHKLI